MIRTSWVCTVTIQVCLCIGLYLAVNLGQPQKFVNRGDKSKKFNSRDVYFISVRGGSRRIEQQTNLLKQMEKVAKKFQASFVVTTSVVGEDDPLMQNTTEQFSGLRVPWYTTKSRKGSGGNLFKKEIKISDGKTLDIIGIDRELSSTVEGKRWLQQRLIRTLESSRSDWSIVIGCYPLVTCAEDEDILEGKQHLDFLHRLFLRFEVNAYLSGQDCTQRVPGSIAFIGNPGTSNSGSYSISLNKKVVFKGDLSNGFLLHRVSSLEIVTYFIASAGEVVHKIVNRQGGREAM